MRVEKVVCPGCGHEFTFRVDAPPYEAKCPKCGRVF